MSNGAQIGAIIDVGRIAGRFSTGLRPGQDGGVGYRKDGQKEVDDTISAYGASYVAGDRIAVALDMDGGTIEFYKNGAGQGSISLPGSLIVAAPASNARAGSGTVTLAYNFGAAAFVDTPPAGFKALNTRNLPDPAILTPEKYFKANARQGTGASASVSGLKFAPDLVWTKSRDEGSGSYTGDHKLWDKVRGATKSLESNTTDNEATEATGLTAFNSDGFDFGALNQINFSGDAFIDWLWKEGALSGFDIVTYTGTGSAQAINHSLGVVPDLIIVKALNPTTGQSWRVYHSENTAAPETDYLALDTSAATADLNTIWNDVAPSSTQFTVGTSVSVNENTKNYIAYLFAEVPGFSKFGAYTGNGNVDGPFVWCGFKPAFVLVKRAVGGVAQWSVHDNQRDLDNPATEQAWPNLNNAPTTGQNIDFLANGFKCRSNGSETNTSGSSYIFAAFAEAPFKYARAR
jgi:hypothetical protein